MPLNVIDTLKPKNGLSFPIVEAIDVFVDGFDNLADAVSHFATDVMIEAINTVLSGKASQADLTALEAVVSAKADASALTTAAANLQAQIDALITPVTQDSEVINARIDANGNTYTSLKQRLDEKDGNVQRELDNINQYFGCYFSYDRGSFNSDDIDIEKNGESSLEHYIRTKIFRLSRTITLKNTSNSHKYYVFAKNDSSGITEQITSLTPSSPTITIQPDGRRYRIYAIIDDNVSTINDSDIPDIANNLVVLTENNIIDRIDSLESATEASMAALSAEIEETGDNVASIQKYFDATFRFTRGDFNVDDIDIEKNGQTSLETCLRSVIFTIDSVITLTNTSSSHRYYVFAKNDSSGITEQLASLTPSSSTITIQPDSRRYRISAIKDSQRSTISDSDIADIKKNLIETTQYNIDKRLDDIETETESSISELSADISETDQKVENVQKYFYSYFGMERGSFNADDIDIEKSGQSSLENNLRTDIFTVSERITLRNTSNSHRYYLYAKDDTSGITEQVASITPAQNEIVIEPDARRYRIYAIKSYPVSAITDNDISDIINNLPISTDDNILERIDALEDESEKTSHGSVPDYFENNLSAAISTINANMAAVGRNGETFVFITDLHWGQNQKHSPALIERIIKKAGVKRVICGGDWIDEGLKDDMLADMRDIREMFDFGTIKMSTVFGNHDSNWNDYNGQREHPERHFDYNTVYANMFYQINENIHYLTNNDFTFWFSDEVSKTIWIGLDTGEENTFVQHQLLCDTLKNHCDGYNVILIFHAQDSGISAAKRIVDKYNNREVFNESDYAMCDFTNCTGHIHTLLFGHAHDDDIDYTSGGIPCITVDTDSRRTHNEYTVGTITEQCFDVITVDYTSGQIRCVRVGRGESRIFNVEE